jgi:RNA polymerase sigma factor (sigma-70 family)
LVRRFLPELKGTALACGLQEQDAYILGNETLEKAIRAIGSYNPRPGATLRSWVYRILINGIRDFARRRKGQLQHEVSREEFVEPEADVQPDADADPQPADGAAPLLRRPAAEVAPLAEDVAPSASAAATLATAILDRLSPRERDVMIRTANGASDQEIAAELRIGLSAVRVARLRARARAVDALRDIAPTLDETIHRALRRLLS